MRISISGAQNTGKTTLVKEFVNRWSMYKTPTKTYRDIITEKNLPHSSSTTTETQWGILNFMVDQLQENSSEKHIIFDRCPLDNLAYTLWAHANDVEGFDKAFVDKCIPIVRESLRHLDIIFLTHFDDNQEIEDDNMRDTNPLRIAEVDNIFSAFMRQYKDNVDADIFFPKGDSPPVIELPHLIDQRIALICEYVNDDGDIYGDEHSIFHPDKLQELEALVSQQKAALSKETEEKELFRKYGLSK